MKKIATFLAWLALTASVAAQTFPGPLPAWNVAGNPSASQGLARSASLTQMFDGAYCNTVGFLIVRFTGAWTCAKAVAANPVWWGADPTGATDSQPAFAAAIAAVGSFGKIEYCGTFKFLETLVIPGNFFLQGCGVNGATITGSGSANLPLFQVGTGSNNPGYVSILDTGFTYATAQTAGAAIWVRNAHNVEISRILTFGSNLFTSVLLDGGAQSFITHLDHFEINNGSFGIVLGQNALIQDVFISDGNIASATVACMLSDNVSGHYGSNVDMTTCGDAWDITPGNGQTVKATRVSLYHLDTSFGNGLKICPTGTGTALESEWVALWSASNGTGGSITDTNGGGVVMCSTGTIQNLKFVGGTIINNKGDGFYIGGGNQISLIGEGVSDNSQVGSASFSGIRVAAGVSNWNILGGFSGSDGSITNLQDYAVSILSGSGNHFAINGLNACGNVTGAVNDLSTGVDKSIFGPCIGWISYTPVVTPVTGAITSYTATGSYQLGPNGHVCFKAAAAITNNGTGASALQITLPPVLPIAVNTAFGVGQETQATGTPLFWGNKTSGNTNVTTLGGSYPVTTGQTASISGCYNTQ